MEPTFQFSAEALAEMRRDHEWMRAALQSQRPGAGEPFTKFGPRVFRWAKCQTNSLCSSYPSRPATNFPIVLGELAVDTSTCGNIAREFTAYDPSHDRIAHDPYDIYREEGDIVAVYLSHKNWYILGGAERMFAEAVLNGDLCALADDDDTEQEVQVSSPIYLPNCKEATLNKVVNPTRHEGHDGDTVFLIRKNCQEEGAEDKWMIFDVEQHEVCLVHAVEERDSSCIVAAVLKLRTEWCPSGEPDDACLIASCTGATCDTTWQFEPLYSCCWMN